MLLRRRALLVHSPVPVYCSTRGQLASFSEPVLVLVLKGFCRVFFCPDSPTERQRPDSLLSAGRVIGPACRSRQRRS